MIFYLKIEFYSKLIGCISKFIQKYYFFSFDYLWINCELWNFFDTPKLRNYEENSFTTVVKSSGNWLFFISVWHIGFSLKTFRYKKFLKTWVEISLLNTCSFVWNAWIKLNIEWVRTVLFDSCNLTCNPCKCWQKSQKNIFNSLYSCYFFKFTDFIFIYKKKFLFYLNKQQIFLIIFFLFNCLTLLNHRMQILHSTLNFLLFKEFHAIKFTILVTKWTMCSNDWKSAFAHT